MGWKFRWVSSFGTDFNHDFGVSFTPQELAKGKVDYNFEMRSFPGEEAPGVSVFYKNDAGAVFRTYSTYGRGVEVMMGAYDMMDLTPNIGGSLAWVPTKSTCLGPCGKRPPARVGGTTCAGAHE